MSRILSRANRAVLERFAWSRVLIALDFDGTLAPIVAKPDDAAMRAATRARLTAVAREYPCIVISGRSQADVARRVRGVALGAVIGNHGIEPWQGARALLREVRPWLAKLERALRSHSGVWIEDKGYSVAVHYRMSRAKRAAREAILRAARELGEIRVIGGKQVVNLLPKDAPHKGMALERERQRFGCDTAIYVGDDETDEDVFALDQPGRLLSIRVGEKRASAAAYSLRDQREVDVLLSSLLALRTNDPSVRRKTA
jgi:trehalose 6-phosphate phosphatase